MIEEMILRYDESTGTWGIKKEPYITIEVETEEDFKELQEAIKKQQAIKPIEVDEREDKDSYYLAFICPACKTTVFGQPYRPNHCKHCGQKLDWSEE